MQNYIRTYIQPLLRAVKQLDLQDILHHVTIKPKWVQQIGNQQLTYLRVDCDGTILNRKVSYYRIQRNLAFLTNRLHVCSSQDEPVI